MTELKRERTFTWGNPLIGASAGLKMSGIDYLKAMQQRALPLPPIFEMIDVNEIDIESGKVTFYFTPAEFHYNPIGTVHGGVITVLLDSAMGCTLHTLLPEGVVYTTIELKVNFLRPVTTKTGRMSCVGKVLNHGSKIGLVEAQLMDEQGKIYAHATSTCMILNPN
jgi:uncharacterized protein (TIGR00369 family)